MRSYICIITMLSLITIMVLPTLALDNITVLETYPDGQPKIGTITGVVYVGDEQKTLPINVEWNSYGQPLRIGDRITLILPFFNDTATNDLYVYQDTVGEIVAFKDTLIPSDETKRSGWSAYAIPSSKTPKELPPFKQAGMNAKDYQKRYNVSRAYLQDVKNYQVIYDNLYKLTPEFQMAENSRLKTELENMSNRVTDSETKVAEQAGLLKKIHDFILQTFGVDLW